VSAPCSFCVNGDQGKYSDPGANGLILYRTPIETSPEQGLMLCCAILGLIVGIVLGMLWAYSQVHNSPELWRDRLEKQIQNEVVR
jgi:hypothetical protein